MADYAYAFLWLRPLDFAACLPASLKHFFRPFSKVSCLTHTIACCFLRQTAVSSRVSLPCKHSFLSLAHLSVAVDMHESMNEKRPSVPLLWSRSWMKSRGVVLILSLSL